MSLRRTGILVSREFLYGPKNFIFIFAFAVPIIMSLTLSLVFGTFFSGKPKIGIVDAGNSQFTAQLASFDFIITNQEFDDVATLKKSVEAGVLDAGLVLPANFDENLPSGTASMDLYIWGQMLLKNRAVLVSAMMDGLVSVTGKETPAQIITHTIGEGDNTPWYERLLPLLLLMAVVFGGALIPATSLIEEKQKRTLKALLVTPTSLNEVLMAKIAMGVIVSTVIVLVTLFLNQAWGGQAALLIFSLVLGSLMVATFGALLGVLIKDVNTLFAVIKGIGILLYAPAFVYLFPGIPQWIAKIFPTYYIVGPVTRITQEGAHFADVALELLILFILTVVLLVATAVAGRRMVEKT